MAHSVNSLQWRKTKWFHAQQNGIEVPPERFKHQRRKLPTHTLAILAALPATTQPMDALWTAVSSLSSIDPDLAKRKRAGRQFGRKAIRLTAELPAIVAGFHRLRNGQQPIAPSATGSVAGDFLYLLFGKKPHDTLTGVLDAALVLHAEHGFNASTFAARVTAATLADMHAAVTAALAVLKGPWLTLAQT